jgi:hypothetical protein
MNTGCSRGTCRLTALISDVIMPQRRRKPLRAVDLACYRADVFGPATGIVTPAAPCSSRQG